MTESRDNYLARMRVLAHKALAERRAARSLWPLVNQPHADDISYLKGILTDSGVTRVPIQEPASLLRFRRLLRRAGITEVRVLKNTGMTCRELIDANPGMALWWLTATTLEACKG